MAMREGICASVGQCMPKLVNLFSDVVYSLFNSLLFRTSWGKLVELKTAWSDVHG